MSLCIIAPCKDSSPGPARTSLARIAAAYAVRAGREPAIVDSWKSSNIADIRAKLAERALDTGADRFLWVDDDIVATREDFGHLFATDEDVVTGAYSQKALDGAFVIGPTPNGERRGKLLELDVIGFGFVVMRRHVIEAIVEARPFECLSQSDRVRGEDEAFSRWWRARGGKMWLHVDVLLGHVGQHIFGVAP